jgi:hypothetical protein
MTAPASRSADAAGSGPATIVRRAVGLGSATGLLAGAGLGAVVTRALGDALGAALLGWTVGLGVGLLDGVVLAAVVRLTRSPRLVVVVLAAVSAGCGIAVAVAGWPAAIYGPWDHPTRSLSWTVVGLAAAGGGVVLPRAATRGGRSAVTRPVRPRHRRRWPGGVDRRPAGETIARTVVAGLLVGGAIGGVVGGYLGLAYWPTAPVAVVEGALIGGLPCGLLGGLAGVAYVLARTRALTDEPAVDAIG